MLPTLTAIMYGPDGTLLYCVDSTSAPDVYFETDFDSSLVKVNYIGNLPDGFDFEQCYNYTLADNVLSVNKFETNPVTFYALLQAKLSGINYLMRNIINWRKRLFNNDTFMQDHIYTLKYNQALAYKATNYDETQLANYPLVQCDTLIHSVSGQVAADKIIKYYLYFEGWLIKNEVTRVTYRNSIWKSTSLDQIAALKSEIIKL